MLHQAVVLGKDARLTFMSTGLGARLFPHCCLQLTSTEWGSGMRLLCCYSRVYPSPLLLSGVGRHIARCIILDETSVG
jgi:hypothetical protein